MRQAFTAFLTGFDIFLTDSDISRSSLTGVLRDPGHAS